jgi:hypothetical protein
MSNNHNTSHNKNNPTSQTPSSKPTQTGAGTPAAGDQNSKDTPTTLDTATGVGSAAMTGPAVANKGTDQVETKVLDAGHEDHTKAGKVTEVVSHVEPTVPSPPAPNEALGIDPSHPTIDSYPSEAAAALAPGIHVDLVKATHPVGVVTHNNPPFHRVDNTTPGSTRDVSEAMEDAKENASGNSSKEKGK